MCVCVCVCVCKLNHSAVHLKLTQQYKSILPKKKKSTLVPKQLDPCHHSQSHRGRTIFQLHQVNNNPAPSCQPAHVDRRAENTERRNQERCPCPHSATGHNLGQTHPHRACSTALSGLLLKTAPDSSRTLKHFKRVSAQQKSGFLRK